jgi:hypothetical protein
MVDFKDNKNSKLITRLGGSALTCVLGGGSFQSLGRMSCRSFENGKSSTISFLGLCILSSSQKVCSSIPKDIPYSYDFWGIFWHNFSSLFLVDVLW